MTDTDTSEPRPPTFHVAYGFMLAGFGRKAERGRPGWMVRRGPCLRDGRGWRCEIWLPEGRTAQEAISKRSAIAAGMRIPVERLEIAVHPDGAAGLLTVYVHDKAVAP